MNTKISETLVSFVFNQIHVWIDYILYDDKNDKKVNQTILCQTGTGVRGKVAKFTANFGLSLFHNFVSLRCNNFSGQL